MRSCWTLWWPLLIAACGQQASSESGAEARALAGEVRSQHRIAADWLTYHGDPGGMRFSLLTQLNPSNVANLRRAWWYDLGAHETSGGLWGGSQTTPIVVDGRLYVTVADGVAALAPETGREVWRHRVAQAPSRRGLAYWDGGSGNQPRIFFTAGARLLALNARTGRRVETFGARGHVDIRGHDADVVPVVHGDLLIIGGGRAPARIQAFDAATGELRWVFRTSSPAPAAAIDTQSETHAGFAMTVDVDRGLLFATFADYAATDEPARTPPAESPSAMRDPRPAHAVVAIDIHTGRERWHYVTLRDDIWGYDAPAAPVLLDVALDGGNSALVAVTTSSGHVYLLDRVTGTPWFDTGEQPAPVDPSGERASALTQPVPSRPPALARVGYEPDDIVTAADTNEAHARFCADLRERSGGLRNEGPFTPFPRHAEDAEDAEPGAVLLFPGTRGGAGWGGAAYDPRLGYLFVNTMDLGSLGWMERVPGGEGIYRRRSPVGGPHARFWWSDGSPDSEGTAFGTESAWPCQRPPWGQLWAVDVVRGEIVWRVPLGVTPELPPERRTTGRPNAGGALATAGGLVFIGAANDRRFRAFDARSGEELWVVELDMSAHAVPMSYAGADGRQYVAVTAGGAGSLNPPHPPHAQALVVYALP